MGFLQRNRRSDGIFCCPLLILKMGFCPLFLGFFVLTSFQVPQNFDKTQIYLAICPLLKTDLATNYAPRRNLIKSQISHKPPVSSVRIRSNISLKNPRFILLSFQSVRISSGYATTFR